MGDDREAPFLELGFLALVPTLAQRVSNVPWASSADDLSSVEKTKFATCPVTQKIESYFRVDFG